MKQESYEVSETITLLIYGPVPTDPRWTSYLMDVDGAIVLIGGGASRQLAITEAVKTLESAVQILQEPAP